MFFCSLTAVISGNFNRLESNLRDRLESLTHKDKLVIKIRRTDPDTMKQVVFFMYTGRCQMNESNGTERMNQFDLNIIRIYLAMALLDAAGRYDIKDLKVHTGRCKFSFFFIIDIRFMTSVLSSRIDTSNVLRLLEAAYIFDNKFIKQRCIEYFINNAKEIMSIHELWKQFAEKHQTLVAELLHWHVNKEVFYADKPQWDAYSQ